VSRGRLSALAVFEHSLLGSIHTGVSSGNSMKIAAVHVVLGELAPDATVTQGVLSPRQFRTSQRAVSLRELND